MKPEDIYIDFASKISFFEFIQEEFRNTDIQPKDFKVEIATLIAKKQWNINDLPDYINKYPRSFIVFQEIFQLLRFTNAQLIHFIFDIVKLNSNNIDALFEYMIFNIKYDMEFRILFLNLIKRNIKYSDFIQNIDKYNKKYLIANFKLTVSKYIDKVAKNFNMLEKRITKNEFKDCSIRFSNYLLKNLKLNEMLSAIDVEKFIHYKKIPFDTKGIHGKYLKIKILEILKKNEYKNIDDILNSNKISTLKHDLRQQIGKSTLNNIKIFCTERYVDGIIKPNDKKPKRFDLIIFSKHKPKYLFEMNFYSTAGTKIGINQNEYISLNNFIKKKFSEFKFCWITDGNYWLLPDGRNRFLNLLNYFEKILNINLFAENIGGRHAYDYRRNMQ